MALVGSWSPQPQQTVGLRAGRAMFPGLLHVGVWVCLLRVPCIPLAAIGPVGHELWEAMGAPHFPGHSHSATVLCWLHGAQGYGVESWKGPRGSWIG